MKFELATLSGKATWTPRPLVFVVVVVGGGGIGDLKPRKYRAQVNYCFKNVGHFFP